MESMHMAEQARLPGRGGDNRWGQKGRRPRRLPDSEISDQAVKVAQEGGSVGVWAVYRKRGEAASTRLCWMVPGAGLVLCRNVDNDVFDVDEDGFVWLTE